MRKLLAVFGVLIFSFSTAVAEPLVLEQAGNVLKTGTLELGLGDIFYQTDVTSLVDTSGTELAKYTSVSTILSLTSRYAFCDKLEGALSVPYVSLAFKSESGGTSITTDDAGLGGAQALVKYNICSCKNGWETSAGLGLSLPTGLQSTKFSQAFRNGLNMKPSFMTSKKCGKYNVNLNLAYNITAEYEDSSAAKTKQNPGDVLSAGAGLEYPMSEQTNLIGEFVYNSISEAASAGTAVSGSSGSQMDLICGVRHNKNNIKTKLGLALAFGDEKYRTYDYKIIAGITYLWQI